MKMGRGIHINIVSNLVKYDADLIRIVGLRIGQTFEWGNPIVTNQSVCLTLSTLQPTVLHLL